MDNGIRYKGLFANIAYYRDHRIYTLTIRDVGGLYINSDIKGFPEINDEFMDFNQAKKFAEKLFLENKEFLDKIIDGMEIYG